jgi:UDP-N-acetylmuramate--alanine ligase
MLFDGFVSSFEKADIVLLHKIYASAREIYDGRVSGFSLYEKTRKTRKENVFYSDDPMEGFELMKGMLGPGDLFVTMGAGDNWKLGKELFNYFRQRESILKTPAMKMRDSI